MENKKIEVTKEQYKEAVAEVMTEDEKLLELTLKIPHLLIFIPLIAEKVWIKLSKENEREEEKENGSTK